MMGLGSHFPGFSGPFRLGTAAEVLFRGIGLGFEPARQKLAPFRGKVRPEVRVPVVEDF